MQTSLPTRCLIMVLWSSADSPSTWWQKLRPPPYHGQLDCSRSTNSFSYKISLFCGSSPLFSLIFFPHLLPGGYLTLPLLYLYPISTWLSTLSLPYLHPMLPLFPPQFFSPLFYLFLFPGSVPISMKYKWRLGFLVRAGHLTVGVLSQDRLVWA